MLQLNLIHSLGYHGDSGVWWLFTGLFYA